MDDCLGASMPLGEITQLFLFVVRVSLFVRTWESYFFGRGGCSSILRVDVLLEKGKLLLPGVETMGRLRESMQFVWIRKVEDRLVMFA